jgi:DNA-binding transcriptional ArsR family regulator
MVNYSATQLDATFAALADATRRAILARLAEGEARVTDLAKPFAMSLPAISKHLRVLESAGLLKREIDGRVHRCHLSAEPMKEAAAWMEHYRRFWEQQFDSLARYLESSTKKEELTCPPQNQAWSTDSKSGEGSPRRARRSSGRGPSATS